MGIIIVYAIDDNSSFQNVKNRLEEIHKYGDSDATIVLAGNKCDTEHREVSYEEGKELADKNGLIFFEISAKEGVHVEELFHQLLFVVKNKVFEVDTK